MSPNSKWIDGIDAEGRVADAARHSLEPRLTAVAQWLPLAAHFAEHDIEHVHRLRVSTRRAIAALRLYRDGLPKKSFRWLKKRLKRVRRAAGDARDLDVLGQRLAREHGDSARPVVALITEKRTAAQSAILEASEKCRRGDKYIRKTARLIERIDQAGDTGPEPTRFRDWAADQLAAAADPFLKALPGDNADPATLHQFRIKAKELRYTIELVAPAFARELRNDVYPIVEELQERLGQIQDRVAASSILSDWADKVKGAGLQELLRELAAEEYAGLDESIADFRAWWTDERSDALRRGLQLASQADVTPTPQVARQM
jgi:CHAD domain-containing protein